MAKKVKSLAAYKKDLEAGKMYDIYGTVKAHRDNTTQLNRVKVIV
jgi:hypothetical protein